MITIRRVRPREESRARDGKRGRFLLSFGAHRWHITREEVAGLVLSGITALRNASKEKVKP